MRSTFRIHIQFLHNAESFHSPRADFGSEVERQELQPPAAEVRPQGTTWQPSRMIPLELQQLTTMTGAQVWRRGTRCAAQGCRHNRPRCINDTRSQGSQRPHRVQLRLAQDHKGYVAITSKHHNHLLTGFRWCDCLQGHHPRGQVREPRCSSSPGCRLQDQRGCW